MSGGQYIIAEGYIIACKAISQRAALYHLQLPSGGQPRFLADQVFGREHLPELRLFDLAGGVPGDVHEDDLPGAFVAGEAHAELVDVRFGAGFPLLDLDDGGGDFAEPLIRQADDRDVADQRAGPDKVLDLDGVEVFAAGDDDVLLPVDEVVKALLVLDRHIAGVEPAVPEDLGGGSSAPGP